MFGFGCNIWLEEAGIKEIKAELKLACKAKKNRKEAIEKVLKDGMKNGIIMGYNIYVHNNPFSSKSVTKIEMLANYSGKTYLWVA